MASSELTADDRNKQSINSKGAEICLRQHFTIPSNSKTAPSKQARKTLSEQIHDKKRKPYMQQTTRPSSDFIRGTRARHENYYGH